MKLDEMLKQQKQRGLKQQKIKARMQSYDEYVMDDASPRPYNTSNVIDLCSQSDLDNNKFLEPITDTINYSLHGLKSDTIITAIPNQNRDTKSWSASTVKEDTISNTLQDLKSDTIITAIPNQNRDTKSWSASIVKEDTISNSLQDLKSDTIITAIPNQNRDTKSWSESIVKEDTISNSLQDLKRDTITTAIPNQNRDTKSSSVSTDKEDTISNSLQDLKSDTITTAIQNQNRGTKSSNVSIAKEDTISRCLQSSKNDLENIKVVSKTNKKNVEIGRPSKGDKYTYLDLSGNAKKLVDEIVNLCMVVDCLSTPNIEKNTLSKNTGVKVGAIKTTACRLKEKGVIISYEATKGRKSSWKFTLSQEILDQYRMYRKGN